MKRMLLLIVTLCLLLTMTTQAVGIDYSGVIDSFTGSATGPAAPTGTTTDDTRVSLGGEKYYDRARQVFLFLLSPSNAEITSTVADGMVTTDPVHITVPEGPAWDLYYNGKKLENPDLNSIEAPGAYVLSVSNGSGTVQPLKFTIVNSVTGFIEEYRLPDRFAVTELRYNDTPASFNTNAVDLTREGRYDITYYCQPTGIGYDLSIEVDHTAPTLALEAVVDSVAKGPVSLDDLEEGATLYVELDGKPLRTLGPLTESGSYVVSVTDPAGNSTVYKFVLQVYFNTNSLVFLVLAIVLIVGIFVYILRSRKKLRVR